MIGRLRLGLVLSRARSILNWTRFGLFGRSRSILVLRSSFQSLDRSVRRYGDTKVRTPFASGLVLCVINIVGRE